MTDTLGLTAGKVACHLGSPNQQRLFSVLYVDDEPTLLDVCKLYLERRGDISVTVADSAFRAMDILNTFCFDVIISDYQMPGMNGIEFLKYLQAQKITIPFILFTGRGREEVVIDAINNGVTSYIQKGGNPKAQFAELEHKVKEASRKHQTEEALIESEMRYRALFENSGTAIVIIEEDMTISLSNAEFSRLTGYLQSEIDGKMRWTDFVLKEDLDTMVAQHRLRRLHRDEALKRYEFRLRSKTGDIHNILLCIDMIQDSEQSVASLMDITKQKQVQSELRRLSDELSSLYRYLARIHTPAFQRNADNWLLSL